MELHRTHRHGVRERECLGVERLMVHLREEERRVGARPRRELEERSATSPVIGVAEHRMSPVREVDADLVRAPGLEGER